MHLQVGSDNANPHERLQMFVINMLICFDLRCLVFKTKVENNLENKVKKIAIKS